VLTVLLALAPPAAAQSRWGQVWLTFPIASATAFRGWLAWRDRDVMPVATAKSPLMATRMSPPST
jgi:hypothetical protein